MSALKLAPVAAVVCAAACGAAAREFPLAASPSAAPIARPGALRAGFGRADITPPPGVGLNGNGFEGQQARGYRHRLYARALALESPAGERVVLVVADLGQMSALLQRRTADRLGRIGIGADRLMLSVTHTHSAPGNFYESSQYNAQAGAFPGYDSAMVEFLVTHLASAASAAVADLAPAKAAWGAAPVPGVTRNRSLDALLLDPEAAAILAPGPLPQPPDAAHDSTLMRRAVNDTLLMLRVDRCSQHWDDCRPRGAFSVFAVHGTVYPPVTDLLDGDVQALVERALERHIDSTGSAEMPQAFHLVANGTEGDVSPDWPAASRCAPYLELRAGRRPAGPRTPAPPEEWRIPDSRVRACLRAARRSVDELGTRLGTAAIALYERIGAKLSAEFPIARAFTTINLTHVGTTHRLCPPPLTGTANFAGAEDGQTRLYGWKFAWLLPSGIEEGGHAVDRHETSCQTPKRIGLGGVQKLLVGRRGLPQYAQLAVLRLGNAVLAAVPGEVTTVAGIRMKRALQDSGPAGIELAGVVGLANGYLQYIPTAEEYRAQDYEGGSAIYGPNTAAALTEELATLAASLARGRPTVRLDPIVASPGPTHSYFAPAAAGPPPARVTRRFLTVSCSAATLSATWVDVYPGALLPADGRVLEIQRQDAGVSAPWRVVAWDDGLEVRADQPLGGAGYRWRVDMAAPDSGRYRVVLTRGGAAGGPVLSDVVACPGSK